MHATSWTRQLEWLVMDGRARINLTTSPPETLDVSDMDLSHHQEDDARLGVTWPRLPSHAKSRQVTQAPQLPRLCRTRPKKRVPGQIRYQGVPRHPNSTDLSDFSDLAKTPQFEVESVKFLVLDQDTPRRPSSHPKTQREGPNS